MLNLLRRVQMTAPSTFSFALGGAIMGVGDAAVQVVVEEHAVDRQRLLVCSAFNASVSVPLNFWYAYLDRVWKHSFASKILFNQVVSSATLTPGFLAWAPFFESLVAGDSPATAVESARQSVESEALPMAIQSFGLWTPVNAIMFAWVPQPMRISYMSAVAVLWGAYCSWVAHRPAAGAGASRGASKT